MLEKSTETDTTFLEMTASSDYQIALTEAAWFTAHPAAASEDRVHVNRLIRDLMSYENQHGVESYELRELKALEDERNK